MMKKTLFCILVSVLLLTVFAVTVPVYGGSEGESPKIDRFILAFNLPAGDSNRIWTAGWINFFQYEPILETLIGNDPWTGAPIPRLAERWEASDDFREWTFYLRQGVPFHYDYGEFTAHDVKHTWELLSRPDSIVNMVFVWRDFIEEVEIIDDYTITFHFREPYIDGERLFSRTAGEMYITSKAQWDAEGVEGMDRRLVGTGVYRFVERVEGERLVVEAVEDHWRDEAPFPEIEWRWIPDETTRLAMLLTEEAHAAVLSRDVAASAAQQGMKVIASQLENMQRFMCFGGSFFNTGEPEIRPDNPFLDLRVRQALIKAVDGEEIRDFIYDGRASIVYLPGWVPEHEGWNEEWVERFDEMYGYDPDRARELLAEAGYGPGELTIPINYTEYPGQPETVKVQEALPIYWEAIGVNTTLIPIEFGAFVGKWIERKETHGEIYSMRNTPIRTTQEFIESHLSSEGSLTNYLHDFIEEANESLKKSLDLDERDRITREIGNHVFDHFAFLPLGATNVEIVVNPEFIADWIWSGNAPTSQSHYYMIEPVR